MNERTILCSVSHFDGLTDFLLGNWSRGM